MRRLVKCTRGGDAASLSTGTGQASVPGSGSSGVLGDSGYNFKVLGREVYLTDERGAPITGMAPDRAANFGLTQADINQALAAAGVDMDSEYAQRFKNKGIEFSVQGSDDLLVDYSNLQRGRSQSGFSGGSSSSGGNGAPSESNTASGVVSSGGSNENMALYGPDTSGITATTSQFIQDPNTFQVTAPQGSTMTAVSPIGSIDLPAAPVEIDIYDYLSDPVFGSLSPIETPIEKNMGGVVPMQTNIAGQPHGLAYINQDEEALLRSFGGSGIMGPGGIPSYAPREYGGGSGSGYTTGTGSKNFDSGYKPITTNYKDDDDDDDKPSSYSAFDDDYEDYTPTSAELNQQLSDAGQTNITSDTSNVNFGTTSSGKDFTTAAQADTDVSGAEFVAAGGLGTGGSGASTAPPSVGLGSTEAVTTYTDMLGNTHSSAADRDRANLAIQQQMYGSGNQAAKNIQQQLYKKYAEQFPEGKRMEGDSEELGRMAADTYLKYAPQINELLGPQGLPNQPFNLPFSFSGIEGITPRGSEDSPDQSSQVDVDQSGVGLPSGLSVPDKSGVLTDILSSPPGLGYPDMSMTAIPGATTPMGYFPEDPGTGFPSSGKTAAGTDPNQFPVEKIQSMFGKGESDKSKATPTKMITSYTDKDGKTTVDDPDTPQNEAVIAQLGLGSSLDSGRDIGVPNAAEAAFLMEALGEMEFDDDGKLVGAEPNFIEQVIGKIIKNLTLGMFDPNDPQRRDDALAILDAYEKTGKFVYDGKEMTIDELIEASKGDGIEPAVIGVRDDKGNIVGFDDGTGFRNTAEGTQNIKTGSFDVFGGGDTVTTTKDDDDDGGSDTGTDTGVDTGHTVDDDGNIVCNTEGYIYNPETEMCEPPKEEEDKDPTINVVRGEDFDDVLKRVVVAAPNVAPISANVQPMQEGGMAGLNRAADNFLKALAG